MIKKVILQTDTNEINKNKNHLISNVMSMENKTCKKCILNEKIKGVQIAENGLCNYCNKYKAFTPYGEDKLLRILKKAKKKKRIYDALVPLSGGKDSTYVLYLAVKKYKLNVLTYTFDNGFMSELAKRNIEKSVKESGVDHIWVKHDQQLINEFYRTILLHSGEICGICGIGIKRSMLKLSQAWKIPVILMGHSPTESNSFTPEDIYDQNRIKAILRKNKNIKPAMLNRFLIYPNLNYIISYLLTITGRFGKMVNILYYINIPSDKEIGKIIKNAFAWEEPDQSDYTRHFDCIAEPFTNYIREKRFGYSRRLPQLCNMIRNNEISRDEALSIHTDDINKILNDKFEYVLSELHLTEKEMEEIGKIPLNVFSSNKSTANLIFASIRHLIKGSNH